MPVAWLSKLQSCAATKAQVLATETDEELVIALSSCKAETHAPSDTVKTTRNVGFAVDELGIPVTKQTLIVVDAAAAISFEHTGHSKEELHEVHRYEAAMDPTAGKQG